jgi:hypothetical protein
VPSTCPSTFNTERPISTVTARQWSNAMTGHAAQSTGRAGAHSTRARDDMTGRAPRNNQTRQCQRPVAVQRAPIVTGRIRSRVTGRAARPINSSPRSTPLGAQTPLYHTNPSLPHKLHCLRKYANTNKCSPHCACVLAFSQSFYRRS